MEVEEQKIVSEELRKNLEENEQLLKESLEQVIIFFPKILLQIIHLIK